MRVVGGVLLLRRRIATRVQVHFGGGEEADRDVAGRRGERWPGAAEGAVAHALAELLHFTRFPRPDRLPFGAQLGFLDPAHRDPQLHEEHPGQGHQVECSSLIAALRLHVRHVLCILVDIRTVEQPQLHFKVYEQEAL